MNDDDLDQDHELDPQILGGSGFGSWGAFPRRTLDRSRGQTYLRGLVAKRVRLRNLNKLPRKSGPTTRGKLHRQRGFVRTREAEILIEGAARAWETKAARLPRIPGIAGDVAGDVGVMAIPAILAGGDLIEEGIRQEWERSWARWRRVRAVPSGVGRTRQWSTGQSRTNRTGAKAAPGPYTAPRTRPNTVEPDELPEHETAPGRAPGKPPTKRPQAPPRLDPYPPVKWPAPGRDTPDVIPRTIPIPLPREGEPGDAPNPTRRTRPGPAPGPGTSPRPKTRPLPRTSPGSPFPLPDIFAPLPYSLPMPRLPKVAPKIPQPRLTSPLPRGDLTPFNPPGVGSEPFAFTQPKPQRCSCPQVRTDEKPPRRKPSCKNPLISRSVSGDILTIKRRLQCQPSKSKPR